MQTHKLNTTVQDNHGYTYTTSLYKRDGADEWVLRVDNTPGHWYMSTLQGTCPYSSGRRVGDSMSIDWGQQWSVTGFAAALAEAESFLAAL